MFQITPKFLSKVIKGAKRQGRKTDKLELAHTEMTEKDGGMWTSRKCRSFKEIEQIFDERKIVRPWRT